jgi:AraC family transcriptional regulator
MNEDAASLETKTGPAEALVVSTPRYDLHSLKATGISLSSVSHVGYAVRSGMAGRVTVEVGGNEFHLSAGETALINPAAMYGLRSPQQQPIELLTLVLHPLTIADAATKLNLNRVGQEFKFRGTIVRDEKLSALLRELLSELRQNEIGSDMVVDSLIDRLVVHLFRHHFSVRRNLEIEISRFGFVDRRLRRAIELIHTHFDEELSIEQMAQAAFLSEFHFARLFKQIVGVTPHAYLASVRMEQAMKLLIATDLSLLEISQRVGYASQSHFTKVFKTLTGMTPREYRQASLCQKARTA